MQLYRVVDITRNVHICFYMLFQYTFFISRATYPVEKKNRGFVRRVEPANYTEKIIENLKPRMTDTSDIQRAYGDAQHEGS